MTTTKTMKRFVAVGAAAALVLSVFAGSAGAQGRGRGQSKSKGKSKGQVTAPANVQVKVVFQDNDRAKFHEYFVTHHWVMDPLPPGIAMNLQRGKPLPPGIAKRVLPRDLVVLVPRDPAVTYYVVGDRVVAVRDGSIIDVLLDIFR